MSTPTIQRVKQSGGYQFVACPCKCGGSELLMLRHEANVERLRDLYADDGSVLCRECQNDLARGTLTRDEISSRPWDLQEVEA